MEKNNLDRLRLKFIRQTEKGLQALLAADEMQSNKPTDLDRSMAGFACIAALAMLCLSVLGPAVVIMAVS